MSRFKLFGLFFATFVVGFLLGSAGASQGSRQEDEYRYFRMFTDVFRTVKENYVGEVNTKELIYLSLIHI